MIYQILHQKLKTEQHNTHKLPLELEYWLPLFWTWTWDVFFLLGIGLEKHIDAAVVISGVEDGTYMKHLASKISSLLINSNNENTFNSYLLSFKRWDNCIKKTWFYALPAQSIYVELYITLVLDSGVSCNQVNSAVYSIKWARRLNNLTNPTDNSFVMSLQEAGERIACPKK